MRSEPQHVFLMTYAEDIEHIKAVALRINAMLDKLAKKSGIIQVYSLQTSKDQISLISWHYDRQKPQAALEQMTTKTCIGLSPDELDALPLHAECHPVVTSSVLPRTDYIFAVAAHSSKPQDLSTAKVKYVFELLCDFNMFYLAKDNLRSQRRTSIVTAIKEHNELHATGKIRLNWWLYAYFVDEQSSLLEQAELDYIQEKKRLLQNAVSATRGYHCACQRLEQCGTKLRKLVGNDTVDSYENARQRYLDSVSAVASYHRGKISREVWGDKPIEWVQISWYDALHGTRLQEVALETAYKQAQVDVTAAFSLLEYKKVFDTANGIDHAYALSYYVDGFLSSEKQIW